MVANLNASSVNAFSTHRLEIIAAIPSSEIPGLFAFTAFGGIIWKLVVYRYSIQSEQLHDGLSLRVRRRLTLLRKDDVRHRRGHRGDVTGLEPGDKRFKIKTVVVACFPAFDVRLSHFDVTFGHARLRCWVDVLIRLRLHLGHFLFQASFSDGFNIAPVTTRIEYHGVLFLRLGVENTAALVAFVAFDGVVRKSAVVGFIRVKAEQLHDGISLRGGRLAMLGEEDVRHRRGQPGDVAGLARGDERFEIVAVAGLEGFDARLRHLDVAFGHTRRRR